MRLCIISTLVPHLFVIAQTISTIYARIKFYKKKIVYFIAAFNCTIITYDNDAVIHFILY